MMVSPPSPLHTRPPGVDDNDCFVLSCQYSSIILLFLFLFLVRKSWFLRFLSLQGSPPPDAFVGLCQMIVKLTRVSVKKYCCLGTMPLLRLLSCSNFNISPYFFCKMSKFSQRWGNMRSLFEKRSDIFVVWVSKFSIIAALKQCFHGEKSRLLLEKYKFCQMS